MKIPSSLGEHDQSSTTTTTCASSPDVNDDHDNVNQAAARRSQTASVMFCSEQDNVVHHVLPLSEYTEEEVRSCWFSAREYNYFKRTSLVTLSLNRNGVLAPEDPEHTMRGLECRTRECTDSRRIGRYRATAAVFEDQARQRHFNVWEPEALSESYHSNTWHAMYDAHCQGLADEQDCLPVFEQTIMGEENKENDFFAGLPLLGRANSFNKRNTVLSKIIAIDEPEEPAIIAGLDSELWSNNICTSGTTTGFNLNSFFNDMSVGIAVAVA